MASSATGPTASLKVASARLSISGRPDPTERLSKAEPFSLVDLQSRVVRYLRVSVTDRCNYRCRYCMPAEGVQVLPRDELLNFDEITRLVRVFVGLGVRRVRLTGGEPLVRRGIVELVERIASIDGVEDLAATTNAHLLPELAGPLRRAGLQRLNVSLDSLDPKVFAEMTRHGDLATVLQGIEAATDAGFENIKINTVVLRGHNDDGLDAMLRFAAEQGHVLRLIEYMPIGVDDAWGPETFISAEEMRGSLEERWHFEAGVAASVSGGGPARYWRAHPRSVEVASAPVEVGFITAISDHFCAQCNRVRLSPMGTLRECLSSAGTLSLRDMVRAGQDDDAIADAIQAALLGKVDGHRFGDGVGTFESMSAIGG